MPAAALRPEFHAFDRASASPKIEDIYDHFIKVRCNNDAAADTAATGNANANVNAAPATEKSKVKATSMPIENKPKAPAKAPAKSDAKDANDGRPRRIQPNQQ